MIVDSLQSLPQAIARASSALGARLAIIALLLALMPLGGSTALWAQTPGLGLTPPNPIPRPDFDGTQTVSTLDDQSGSPIEAPTDSIPTALPDLTATPSNSFDLVPPDPNAGPVPLRFAARLTEDGPELSRDVIWSIYALNDRDVSEDDLVLNAQGGVLQANLPPGSYIAHVSYGLATLSRPLTIGPNGLEESFSLTAGGMTLRGAIASNDFLPNELVHFAVYSDGSEDSPLIADVEENTVLVVPAGRYTVVSRYGDVNATVRAQIDVEPGQLTEAVMFHQAAQITLKLVNEPNGEALPNTSWSVLNAGGDVVREFVGAFPTMILSQADYTIIARHDGQVFSREFAVIAGIDREVELVAQ